MLSVNDTRPLRFDRHPPQFAGSLEELGWDDTESWEKFTTSYWNVGYGVARQVGLSDEEARDVVQPPT
jgi:hypothetical protein